MSSFDEAFRRQEAEAQEAQARQHSQADAARRMAEAAAPIVQRMLDDFLQAVSGRVRPKRYKMGTGSFNLPRLSPSGYALYRRGSGLDTSLVLVTRSGRVWEHWGYGRRKGYVEISGETLANGRLTLTSQVYVGADGMPYITGGFSDDRRAVLLQESLAAAAHRLINE